MTDFNSFQSFQNPQPIFNNEPIATDEEYDKCHEGYQLVWVWQCKAFALWRNIWFCEDSSRSKYCVG